MVSLEHAVNTWLAASILARFFMVVSARSTRRTAVAQTAVRSCCFALFAATLFATMTLFVRRYSTVKR